ncbi:MAG: UDP-4-amino-4,6-dideoxy-N-acetyl-beta-L-altrosamine transaminase [Imperialibacter sp.]|uniref:UDP-4-amino-4, 6-dideoxy-N-acetyl-beta-L-altrosamine transaminase n=1 Tax=Imperialibacter sp. TaxID=2038411 RepID=UPI003A84837A
MKQIPYGRQHITEEDIQAVVHTLQSDFLTQGPKITEFEEAFAAYVGSKYAVAVSNGTAALHLSALALDVKNGDNVITTPITFAASANCIRYCGGNVVFSDIDPESYLLDVDKVRSLLESSPKGTYKGIVPVDFAGRAINMQEIADLAKEHGLWIIEDACHAPGGYFTDQNGSQRKCGSGQFADLAIFSFHPVKHIASGEGGMITTNDYSLYKRLLMLRTHGITRESALFKNTKALALGEIEHMSFAVNSDWPGWYMEMQELGYNCRLTDFQAALGLSQLKRADGGLQRRREIAGRYYESFIDTAFIKGQSRAVEGHAYHLYIIEIEDRIGLYNHLRTKNILPQVHYIPCHLMPYYQSQGWTVGDFPNAERYYTRCLSLPMYPTLTDQEQDFVIKEIKSYFS